MKIPSECQSWAKRMRESPNTKSVLQNIKDDPCPSKSQEGEFFSFLQKEAPKTAEEAHQFAVDAVKSNRDDFLCSGREISEEIFCEVMRVQKPSSLKFILPEGLLDEYGMTEESAFSKKDDVEDILDTFECSGLFELSGDPTGVGVVWVTDNVVCEAETLDVSTLINRLGLEHLKSETFLISLIVRRDAYPTGLHVPRCFDGVDFPPFKVQVDPNADCGMTEPLSTDEKGLPEAVHWFCEVENAEIKVID